MKRWSIVIIALVIGGLAGSYLVGPYLHGQQAAPITIPKELTSYRDVVKRVLPAVVSIETHVKARKPAARAPRPDDPRIPEEFRRFFEEFHRDMPEMPQQGFGSGFFVEAGGVILTNYHVVEGAETVTVTLTDGRKFKSKDIRGDRRTDLAIIRLDAKGPFPYLEMGDSDTAEIGDRVLAVGAPFGLAGSVTHGIISAKGRNLNMHMYEDFLQTDAAINPGNSGGPLVSLDGKVVGINAAIKSRSGGFQGIGLAVASNLAKNVMKALLTEGVVRRGYLGVQVRELEAEIAQKLGVPKDSGVLVAQVFDNTPAQKANIQSGDVITSIAGKPVKDGRALQTVVATLPINKPAEVTVWREGKAQTVKVTIEEQPAEFGVARVPTPQKTPAGQDTIGVDKVGIQIADLTDEMAEEWGYRKNLRGAVITRVEPGSLAAEAGLRRGMLITKVDNQRVTTAAATRQALEAASLARGTLLQVQTPQGGTNYVLLKSESE